MFRFLSTESLARMSARRPWPVIGVWLVLLAASLAVSAAFLSDSLTTEIDFTNDPESKRAEDLLEEGLRGPAQDREVVIVQSDSMTVDDPAFRAVVERVYAAVTALGPSVISGGSNYYQPGGEALASSDRHTTILPFVMAGDEQQAQDNIGHLLDTVEDAGRPDGVRVLVTGGASINHEHQETAERDLRTGEMVGIPIALVVLVIVFGALTAALIPLVLGVIAIVVALAITALVGQGSEFSFFVVNVISMMGLAVGIDYSLFVLSRYREERGRGLEKTAAITAAGATSSRAVLFSGVTVVLALLGMLIVPSTIFRSLAAGAIFVVLAAVLASLTLLPAVLGVLGDRVNTLRLPIVGRKAVRQDHEAAGGFWDSVTRTVMRHPVASIVLTVTLLVAMAVPYVDIKTGSAGISTLPDNLETKQGFEILEKEFSFGMVSPTEIAISGDVNSPEVRDAIARLRAAMAGDPAFGQPTLQTNTAGDVALLSVPVNGDPLDDAAIGAVQRLRDTYIPAAFDGVDAEALVGGLAAKNVDYFSQTDRYTAPVIAFVLALSFVLLTVVFRSLVVPLKAIIMNLLSVGAAYGLLVLVFQKGIGNEVFGFQQVDIVEAWVPLFTFSILFGLSMDYHVFLLSRIRERYNQTGDNAESVAYGLRSSAGIITGAALIMVAVFGGIAAGEMVAFQQMGFGLGVAVLLDATVVRSVLVPAAMELLGDANWYLPPVLRWLPEVRAEGPESTHVTPGTAQAG